MAAPPRLDQVAHPVQTEYSGRNDPVPIRNSALGRCDRIRRNIGGDKRVRLESPCGRAQSVLDRVGLTTEFGRPLLTPHGDFGESVLQHPKHLAAYARVGAQQIGGHCQRPNTRRPPHHREETVVQIEGRGAENHERSRVAAVSDQDVDVPAGPRAVA